MQPNLPPLWECPKCGERFVTKNIWHACGKFTVENLFARNEPHLIRLFKTEKFAPHFIMHSFRVYSDADLDHKARQWMCESYKVGGQKLEAIEPLVGRDCNVNA